MKLLRLDAQPHENNRNYIYRVLKESIISLNIAPGESISETQIQNCLEVSRSPIREALAALSVEELVDVYPQRKSVVTLIDAGELEQVSFIREILENEMVKKCISAGLLDELTERKEQVLAEMEKLGDVDNDDVLVMRMLVLDEQFHGSVYSLMNCEAINKTLRISNNQYNRFQALRRREISIDDFVFTHRQALDIVRTGDIDAVDAHFRQNIDTFGEKVSRLKELYSEYFTSPRNTAFEKIRASSFRDYV